MSTPVIVGCLRTLVWDKEHWSLMCDKEHWSLMCDDGGWTPRFIIHGLTLHLITFYYEAVLDSVNQPHHGGTEGWRKAGKGGFTDGFNQ